ncbi:conserved hypothetical protein [Beutenbergia cavernae DSM 12333]|uniref:Uncharacterized protein n=1 Tax=Beutenbergia cavernae (strain ATCC BAA-8 / DSM 12333 / CCUG 43141 / JCM 11478 / NBRC 16432 / NCIMB 13614 / HKI 0122) TaxID=471853 RepID=C5C5N1_BEUC1|nr:hypothetical protein [Beutenbergia cavernae]ACQ80222.1 conserved hypothetical protein [Beutenbergia cavernae DSM 12333]
MPQTVIVLTENTLKPVDAQHIVGLHEGQDVTYEVLVPADTERNVVAEIIDHLSLFELKKAWDDMIGKEPSDAQARATAHDAVAGSVAALEAEGATAQGSVVADDPIPALRQALANTGAGEIVVVTYAKPLEDTFHRDWASRAREELGVPVLHFYSGTSYVG